PEAGRTVKLEASTRSKRIAIEPAIGNKRRLGIFSRERMLSRLIFPQNGYEASNRVSVFVTQKTIRQVCHTKTRQSGNVANVSLGMRISSGIGQLEWNGFTPLDSKSQPSSRMKHSRRWNDDLLQIAEIDKGVARGNQIERPGIRT